MAAWLPFINALFQLYILYLLITNVRLERKLWEIERKWHSLMEQRVRRLEQVVGLLVHEAETRDQPSQNSTRH